MNGDLTSIVGLVLAAVSAASARSWSGWDLDADGERSRGLVKRWGMRTVLAWIGAGMVVTASWTTLSTAERLLVAGALGIALTAGLAAAVVGRRPLAAAVGSFESEAARLLVRRQPWSRLSGPGRLFVVLASTSIVAAIASATIAFLGAA